MSPSDSSQPELLQGQRLFAAALRDAALVPRAIPLFAGDVERVAQRLAIYRGNSIAAASKALSLVYPVIQKMLGEEFFAGLARAYWQAHPARNGNLARHGDAFADFFATFAHTATYPWLPDLARLEWAVHGAASAADVSAAQHFDPASLMALDPDQLPELRFRFTPGFATLTSPYPIAHLWTLHQEGYDGVFEVDWAAAQSAVVYRQQWRVNVAVIDPAQHQAMALLCEGQNLSSALDAAYAVQADFDFEAALAQWLAASWIAQIYFDAL